MTIKRAILMAIGLVLCTLIAASAMKVWGRTLHGRCERVRVGMNMRETATILGIGFLPAQHGPRISDDADVAIVWRYPNGSIWVMFDRKGKVTRKWVAEDENKTAVDHLATLFSY